MAVRNASIVAILTSVAAACALAAGGCGKSPVAADGIVTVTQTTSTTTTTVIPDIAASGIAASPQGVGLAAATLFRFSLQTPPTGGVPPYTVAWDFGDGSAAEGEVGVHKFLDPGEFAVAATVGDSAGGKPVKLSLPVSVRNVSGDWGITFARVVPRQFVDILQNGEAITAAINKGPGTSGSGTGTGSVANPRVLSLSITFANAVPSPYTVTFVGTLDERIETWTGTANGYPGCPCEFVAGR